MRRPAPWLAALLLAAGCATFEPHRGPVELAPPRPVSAETELDRELVRAGFGAADGLSGFHLLDHGDEALIARLALADRAGRSLDLQTYIYDFDAAGLLVLGRLLAAGDRGVRVRLLLDDTTVHSHEAEWLAVDAHPAIEVRAFNPFRVRQPSYVEQLIDYLTDFGRLNHRMHNKLMVGDGGFAIVGGRNVAADYFLLDEVSNFRDLDLLAAGPVATETSAAFDLYWNSGWAVPLRHLASAAREAAALERLRARIGRSVARGGDLTRAAARQADLAASLGGSELVPARGEVLVDRPEKLDLAPRVPPPALRLLELVRGAEREVELEVSYLILPREGIEIVRELVARGVAVRVLTNSLATNDVVAAHAGYVPTRRALLEAGVELWELRPDGPAGGPARRFAPPSGSGASLHSKTILIDGRVVYIGSMNLDPRSVVINTEIGLVVESPELGARVAAFLAEGRRPGIAWRVRLRGDVDPRAPANLARQLVWIEESPAGTRLRRSEPRAGPWRKLKSKLLGLLPISGQL